MSTGAQEWDQVIPEDGSALLEDLRRHGVRPGQRVHLRAVPDAASDPVWNAFLGSGGDSDPDLSVNAKRIVRDQMGE